MNIEKWFSEASKKLVSIIPQLKAGDYQFEDCIIKIREDQSFHHLTVGIDRSNSKYDFIIRLWPVRLDGEIIPDKWGLEDLTRIEKTTGNAEIILEWSTWETATANLCFKSYIKLGNPRGINLQFFWMMKDGNLKEFYVVHDRRHLCFAYEKSRKWKLGKSNTNDLTRLPQRVKLPQDARNLDEILGEPILWNNSDIPRLADEMIDEFDIDGFIKIIDSISST